ncbi:MAG TPA: 1,2-phenylacetyl-CoA epoxidase subunit PaaD [Ignavibacteria bacterium]|nr:1,2-phenylacetyl-CoA epoxidase subunit PaaD [Ignavibacteria bacterium]
MRFSTLIKITKEDILEALQDVKDPEIPTISVVDLGIITGVEIDDDNFVKVTMTPTFSGCPALKIMENMVKERIEIMNISGVEVTTNFDTPWSTNMITPKGIEGLKKHGLAPPEKHNGMVQIEILEKVKCPHCGSRNTTLKTPFGPTLCRSMHYCNECLNAFEQFKPVD